MKPFVDIYTKKDTLM